MPCNNLEEAALYSDPLICDGHPVGNITPRLLQIEDMAINH